MKLLILSSHAILEYDELRLFSRLGYDVFMPGGYADPLQGNDLRPGVPEAPRHPELAALVQEQRERHAGESDAWPVIDWGKADLHPNLIEWADVIMVNCFPEPWIGAQWDRIQGKRVVWRTIGQSGPATEQIMGSYAKRGLQIVRYSPAEGRAFAPLGVFAGQDAMIRFAKDPADFAPWIGDELVVGNVTQNMDERAQFTGYDYWLEATRDLPTRPSGLGSERIGGTGPLSYPAMLDYLRHLRCYLYTGTQPASYTLGLMEAMLAGVPVVSRGSNGLWLPDLFEGSEIALAGGDPVAAAKLLGMFLGDERTARFASESMRARAVSLFSYDVVGPQWVDFLGEPGQLTTTAQVERRLAGVAA